MAAFLFFNDILHFNPRPREEGDVTRRRCAIIDTYFNPRPREEGD